MSDQSTNPTTELPAGLITHDRLAGAALLGRHDEFRAMFKLVWEDVERQVAAERSGLS